VKILELELMGFGPFSDFVLDLGPDGAGLHVVLGSNEAGKSTALRAISGLLFGIPERSPDSYLHGYGRMRIGARIEEREGRVLRVVRLKKRARSLVDADGNPFGDDVLAGLLGGFDVLTCLALGFCGFALGGFRLLACPFLLCLLFGLGRLLGALFLRGSGVLGRFALGGLSLLGGVAGLSGFFRLGRTLRTALALGPCARGPAQNAHYTQCCDRILHLRYS